MSATPKRAYEQRIDHSLGKNVSLLIQAASPARATPNKQESIVRIFGEDSQERANFEVTDSTGSSISHISQVMSLDTGGGVLVRGQAIPDRFLCVDSEVGVTTDDVSLRLTHGRDDHRALPIHCLTPQRKHRQYHEQGKTLHLYGIGGAGSDTLFTTLYDSRAPGGGRGRPGTRAATAAAADGENIGVQKIDEDSARTFASITFTACKTTAEGYMVTGDSKGAIRLYDDVSRALAVHRQVATGDPVIDIDVSDGGEFILWTTADGIFVLNYKDGEAAWGKKGEVRPRVLRLEIRESDHKKILDDDPDATFLPAKFDLESVRGYETKNIVAYFGNYIVLWKSREVTLAAKKLAEKVAEADDADSIPPQIVYSTRVSKAKDTVEDHTPLVGEASDVASLVNGIQNIDL